MVAPETGRGSSVGKGVFVVLPAWNEEPVVEQVIREIVPLYPNVIVVDDGSADRTAERARRAGARVLRHVVNRGQGAALQTGIEYSLQQGADYVVTFDCDGQHRVEDIEVLLAPLQAGRCQVSLGSRFVGTTEGMPWTRMLLLKLAVSFTRVVSGVRLTDAHNGLRAFHCAAARHIQISMDRMAHASQIVDDIRNKGLTYEEVPVRVRYTPYSRTKGQSSAHAFRVFSEYILGRFFR